MAVSASTVKSLVAQLDTDLGADARLGKPRRYLAGEHDAPYMPAGAKAEFKHLAKRCITNWTPLLPDTFVKALYVEGYRPSDDTTGENSTAWDHWQDNGLDARQTVAHRGALEFGTSYVLVLKGKDPKRPKILPLSPLRSMAWYADEDDEFPEYGLRVLTTRPDKTRVVEVYDALEATPFTKGPDAEEWTAGTSVKHGLGVTPFVRFRDRIDGEAFGIVRPFITLQDRVNEVVFATLIAMQYASFRQRWATGLAIPVDEETGNPVQPFEAAVNRLWVSDSTETKFGDFAQTDIRGHLDLYKSTVTTLITTAQIAPAALTGDLVNVGAETLSQLKETTNRKMAEYAILFGESWEQVMRLAALAAGDSTGANDRASQVRWRDLEGRDFAATVDGLGKIATMLGVPGEALWPKIPGVTDTDVGNFKAMAKADPLDELTRELTRQTATAATAAPPGVVVTDA